ncbi:hypothetical protein L596_008527 [Steinernema carpocapsae]|uniref:Uncharacterized protein n=1 Tax=Steinernema carpocapsae TaxID=34508 RepID=A0A4V6A6D7_STECR|nr:hypothetical protein L596_008527 [Steinernema carpocapsae]
MKLPSSFKFWRTKKAKKDELPDSEAPGKAAESTSSTEASNIPLSTHFQASDHCQLDPMRRSFHRNSRILPARRSERNLGDRNAVFEDKLEKLKREVYGEIKAKSEETDETELEEALKRLKRWKIESDIFLNRLPPATGTHV